MYGMLDLSGIRFPCRLIKQFFFGFLIKYHLIFTWSTNKIAIFFMILIGVKLYIIVFFLFFLCVCLFLLLFS
jgi:hypothetical protein